MCIGPIQPRLICCAASLSAAGRLPCGAHHRSARVQAALGNALTSQHDFACPARPSAGAAHRRELAARHALSKQVVEGVAERTGGVPLFVEEVTRLLLERGEQGGIQAIPPTLQQSLLARLDRLGPASEVAQIGAVIGRGFSYDLLRDIAGMEDAALQAALEKLAEADIVLVQGLPPDSEYRFKHALIQDAAYENLLKTRRQVLHRRVAEILRDRLSSRGRRAGIAGASLFPSGSAEAAIEWLGKAGQHSVERSALVEAAGAVHPCS